MSSEQVPLREFPVPVVAVLNGDAIGGGAELAVACDFRIMRDGTHIGYLTTPAQFGAVLKDDIAKWSKVVKDSGAKVD